MAADVPRILVINCRKETSQSVIASEILRHSKCEDCEPLVINKGTVSYKWRIDNKYYTAATEIYATDDLQCIGENVEAVVMEIDDEESSFCKLKDFTSSLLELCEPDVRLVIFTSDKNTEVEETHNNSSDDNFNNDLQQWCLENNFEIVEMFQGESEDEVDGIARIVDALHAHTWPNLELKALTTIKAVASDCDTLKLTETGANTEAIDPILLERISLEDDTVGSFEEIFSNLKDMKENASRLPLEDRKVYAEKMAVAFWKAMGGDAEEIAGVFQDGED